MAIDPNIPLQAGQPAGPFGPNWPQVFAAQQQGNRNYFAQQEIAGQNALRGVLGDPNNLNALAGPGAGMFAPVFSANPQSGMDALLGFEQIYQHQQRAAASNLATLQKYNGLIDSQVMMPLFALEDKLQQDPGISPEQRQILLNQKKHELVNSLKAQYGLPENFAQVIDQPYNSQDRLKSGMHQAQQLERAKRWEHRKDSSTSPPTDYDINTFTGEVMDPAHAKPYVPGTFRDPSAAAKPISPKEFIPAQVKDPDSGEFKPRNVLIVPGPSGNRITDESGSTLNPADVQLPQAGARSAQVPKTQNIMVRKPDGSTEPVPVNEVSDPAGGPPRWRKLTGEFVDPSTIVTTNVPAATAEKPQYSQTAITLSAQQGFAGDPAAFRAGWGDVNYRTQLRNKMADMALEQWGEYARVKDDKGKINKIRVQRDPDNPGQYLDTDGNKIDSSKIVEAKIPSPDAGGLLAALDAGFTSKESALRGMERMRGIVRGFEGTANTEADRALNLAQGALATHAPIFNKWIQSAKKNVVGDPEVVQLNAAVETLANEYAKVMSSPGATGAVTSDTAREQARSLINNSFNMGQFQGAIAQMKGSMADRMKRINESIDATLNDIKTGPAEIGAAGPMPASPTPTQFAPGQRGTEPSGAGATTPIPFDTIDAAKAHIKSIAKPGDGMAYPLSDGTWWYMDRTGTLRQTTAPAGQR